MRWSKYLPCDKSQSKQLIPTDVTLSTPTSHIYENGHKFNMCHEHSLTNTLPLQKTIDKLPDKLLLHIFSYLQQCELGKVAPVCKKWRLLAYDPRLWMRVSLRPEYSNMHVNSTELFIHLINSRFNGTLRYIELPCDLVTAPGLHELAAKCPNLKYLTLDFSNAMQLHDFNDLNAFPCNLRALSICLSEVIFLEGFMRKVYQSLSSLAVLHLIGMSNHTAIKPVSIAISLLF